MKVTFLDIDGVVATDEALEKMLCSYYGVPLDAADRRKIAFDSLADSPMPQPLWKRQYFPFSTEAIENLYSLQRQTGCAYVMSSTWKKGRSVEDINDIMALKGLYLTFVGKIPDTSDTLRGEEIARWLRGRTDVERYVVIDDAFGEEGDVERLFLNVYHPGKVVLTDPYDGFTRPRLEEAVRILNGE